MLKNLLGIVSMLLFCSFAVQEQDKQSFGSMLSDAAIELTKIRVIYDPNYYVLDYPNGDLPADRGVCTDVVVRAYRKLGIDLQKEVHEDMKANFHLYPNNWGLSKPDRNIDHRRVPNLMVYFSRYGRIKAITTNPEDYQPGDIVAWDLGGGTTHIGIVISQKSHDGKRNLIVHNIGNGQEISDCLFEYSIIGHYQYPEW
ncbi:MAG: DUF1287 domain-containing protein [Rikenellaceae bacterium]|nr:DUF1287 domain-containing protein [Rikenellaceae bacterium]